jgi:hypothetical protein
VVSKGPGIVIIVAASESEKIVGGWSEPIPVVTHQAEDMLDDIVELAIERFEPGAETQIDTTPSCTRSSDCPQGEHCGSGKCVAECKSAADCGSEMRCDGYGRCVLPEPEPCPEVANVAPAPVEEPKKDKDKDKDRKKDRKKRRRSSNETE